MSLAAAPRDASPTSTRSWRLERATFPTDAWSRAADARASSRGRTASTSSRSTSAEDRRRDGYAGLLAPARRGRCRHPDHRGRRVRPAAGLGRGLHARAARRGATRAASRERVPRGARRQPGRAGAVPLARASSRSASRRGYYQPDDVDARRDAARASRPAAPRSGASRARATVNRGAPRARHRDVAATRPASASCAARTLLANSIASLDGRARPLRRRRARGRRPRAPRGAGARRSRPRSPRPASTLADLDADRGHQRSGPRRRPHGRRRRGQGARARARASRSTRVNHLVGHVGADLARRRRRRRSRRPTVALLVSGGHTSLLLVRDLVVRRRAARRDHRRRRGRGVRQGRAAARAALPGRPADRPRRASAAIPTAIRFPRGLTLPKDLASAPLRLLVLRAEDRRRPLGRAARGGRASRCRSPTSRQASARRSSTCWSRKAVAACTDLGVPRLLLGGGVVANSRLREVAAASGRMPPASRCASRRCRSAPTTAR